MNSANKRSPGAKGEPQPLKQQAVGAPQLKLGAAQLKTAPSAQSVKQPVAPPVYRPQARPATAQPKMANGAVNRKPPVAPTVYRPEAKKILQPKANQRTGVVQPFVLETIFTLGAMAAGAWYLRDHLFGQPQQPPVRQQPQPQPQQQLPPQLQLPQQQLPQQQPPVQNPVPVIDVRANFLAELQARPQRAQEQPVSTLGNYNFYYHQHRNEYGYHIKIDGGGMAFVGINVNPNGTPRLNRQGRLASIRNRLNVGNDTAQQLDDHAQNLMRPLGDIQVTQVR